MQLVGTLGAVASLAALVSLWSSIEELESPATLMVLNWSEPDSIDRSPFWISCSEGKVKAAALLASIKGVDINKSTLASETPLYAAAQNGGGGCYL